MPKHGPNIWVVRRGTGFSIKAEGIAAHILPPVSQRMAIGIGRLLALANESELIVQGANGRIRERDSHGSDSPYRDG